MAKNRTSLLGLYRALITTTKVLGYKYSLMPGENGVHRGFPNQEKKIMVGRELDLIGKIVILSHELGHALDIQLKPFSMAETLSAIIDWERYITGKRYYARERRAWELGKTLLKNMGRYEDVSKHFNVLRKKSLRAYKNNLSTPLKTNEIANHGAQ